MSDDGLFERLAEMLGPVSEELEPAFTMTGVLDLPAHERALIRHVMRRDTPANLAELADELSSSVVVIRQAVDSLVDQGALDFDGHLVMVAAITLNRRVTPGGMWSRLSGLPAS
jgi:hypothetical protein